MTNTSDAELEVESFLADWDDEHDPAQIFFKQLFMQVRDMAEVKLSFTARPGVSYSLRPCRTTQRERELFAIIDVIDDENRWLSVCFYEDMITDPESSGEIIPGGLAGSDGYCFDILDQDEELLAYVAGRMQEAWENAVT